MHTLEVVAVLGLLAHNFDDGVDELGALDVVALGPVVSDVGLAIDEVVGGRRCRRRDSEAAGGSGEATARAGGRDGEAAARTGGVQAVAVAGRTAGSSGCRQDTRRW